MKKLIFLVGTVSFVFASHAQITVQSGAGLHLQPKSFITVQDDLESKDDVSGEGVFILNGHAIQNINFHGKQVSGLMIENVKNVQLGAPISITGRLVLDTGHLICNNYALELGETAIIEGGTPNSYIITSAGGKIRQQISVNLNNYLIPVGNSNGYAPLFLTTSGKYRHAFIEVSSQNKVHPNKPATDDYLQHYWSLNRMGIDGTLQVKAKYKDIEGSGEHLKAFYWNGLAWNDNQSQIDTRNRMITVGATEGRGEIYAFNPSDGNDRDSRISVFPNPAQSTATVRFSSKYDTETDVIVYDVYGHVVMIKKVVITPGINRVNVNVSGLAKGQYTIKLSASAPGESISFIKG
jgi:hypothetical protein